MCTHYFSHSNLKQVLKVVAPKINCSEFGDCTLEWDFSCLGIWHTTEERKLAAAISSKLPHSIAVLVIAQFWTLRVCCLPPCVNAVPVLWQEPDPPPALHSRMRLPPALLHGVEDVQLCTNWPRERDRQSEKLIGEYLGSFHLGVCTTGMKTIITNNGSKACMMVGSKGWSTSTFTCKPAAAACLVFTTRSQWCCTGVGTYMIGHLLLVWAVLCG